MLSNVRSVKDTLQFLSKRMPHMIESLQFVENIMEQKYFSKQMAGLPAEDIESMTDMFESMEQQLKRKREQSTDEEAPKQHKKHSCAYNINTTGISTS